MKKFESSIICILLLVTICSCQTTNLEYNLIEEEPIGTYIGNVKTDSSLRNEMTDDEFSRLKFQILTEGSAYALLFSITDENGILESASVIDREQICESLSQCILGFSINVFKRDPDIVGKLIYVKLLQIGVKIQDINDNPPKFPEPVITVNVSESVSIGYIILTSTASDKDSGVNNSVQTYEIISFDNVFGVQLVQNPDGTSNLGITVKKKLDREFEDFYLLTITARDYGDPQRNGTLTVRVNIMDDNDNSPKFVSSSYTVNVIENPKIGSVLLRVTAIDLDIDKNGQITYHFSSRTPKKVTELLNLNETTGEITAKGIIDYEVNQNLTFYVEARDHGSSPQASQTIITINVLDINDNAPKININFPKLSGNVVSEDAKIGQYIATVVVQDDDNGVNGTVSCSLENDKFELTKVYENFYKINLKDFLDREEKAQHNVTVTCSDKGTPSKQNTSSFIIIVSDVNDNAPMFAQSVYEPIINENNAVGEIVAIVTATDPDEGENGDISYYMSSDLGDVFSVSLSSGIIIAKQVFDRETVEKFEFNVTAFDNGTPRFNSTVMVIVTIGDKNDHAPVFMKPVYNFTVQENLIPGTIIGKMLAYDNDKGENGRLMFSQNHPFSNIFQIKQNSGEIMIIDVLDRESRDYFEFNLTVSDYGSPPKKSTTKIEIFITDENDNFPVITFPTKSNFSVQIPATQEVNSVITRVTAYDLDLGKNSELTFHIIQGDQQGHFQIQNKTGNIILIKAIHPEDYGMYTLLIAVQDGGIPMRTSWTNLELTITTDDGKQNMLIAITVCVVTVILSAAMIIVICIIRRRDSLKEQNQKMDPQKSGFVNEWLKCLSTSSKELQSLGSGKTMEPLRTLQDTDKKPMVGGSEEDNDSLENKQIKPQSMLGVSHLDGNISSDSVPPKRESPSKVTAEDGNNKNNVWYTGKYFQDEQRIVYEDKPTIVYHKRYTPESFGQILQTAVSDLSLSENWKQRQTSPKPQYDRNLSMDDEILKHSRRPILHSASSFRSSYEFGGSSLQDSGFFSQTDTLQSDQFVVPYQSHSLNRHKRPYANLKKSGLHPNSSGKHVRINELPTISATPEPYHSCSESGSVIEPPSQFMADADLNTHRNHRNKYQNGPMTNYRNDYIELEDNVFNTELVV